MRYRWFDGEFVEKEVQEVDRWAVHCADTVLCNVSDGSNQETLLKVQQKVPMSVICRAGAPSNRGTCHRCTVQSYHIVLLSSCCCLVSHLRMGRNVSI